MASSARTSAPAGPSAYIAEFVGTLLLVFGIGAVASANSAGGIGSTDFVAIGLVHGLLLTGLVAAFAGISGANLNPAVTIALLAIRKLSPATAIAYIVAQLLGAVAAAGLLALAFTGDIESIANLGAAGTNAALLTGKDGLAGGVIFELLGVFALVSVIVATAVHTGGNRTIAPVAIGVTLGAANLITGPFTGGALNPARAFGPALIGGDFGPAGVYVLVYVLAPIVGGVLAAVLFQTLSNGSAAAADTTEA